MQSNNSSFASLLIVLLAGVVSALLLVLALISWMAEWFGSIVVPALLVGCFFAVVAVLIYWLHLRDALSYMHDRLVAVCDMVRLFRDSVDLVISLLFGRGK